MLVGPNFTFTPTKLAPYHKQATKGLGAQCPQPIAPWWLLHAALLSETPMSATYGWNKAMQRHAKPHSAATHFRPSVVLQHKGGKVASCNKKGNEVGIMLANNTQG